MNHKERLFLLYSECTPKLMTPHVICIKPIMSAHVYVVGLFLAEPSPCLQGIVCPHPAPPTGVINSAAIFRVGCTIKLRPCAEQRCGAQCSCDTTGQRDNILSSCTLSVSVEKLLHVYIRKLKSGIAKMNKDDVIIQVIMSRVYGKHIYCIYIIHIIQNYQFAQTVPRIHNCLMQKKANLMNVIPD